MSRVWTMHDLSIHVGGSGYRLYLKAMRSKQ